MDEKTVQQLMQQLTPLITPEKVYKIAESRLDITSMINEAKTGGLTIQDVGFNFAYPAFLSGMEFALRSITQTEGTEEPDQGGGAQNG